jgi:ABC-type uncharacterized transport system substrate-binding protein
MITGVFQQSPTDKQLELLKVVRPQGTTFGYLMNAANPGNPAWRKEADDAARRLGIKLEIVEVKHQSDIADAIESSPALPTQSAGSSTRHRTPSGVSA